MKKRILLVNESSLLSTGYANYGRELLSALSKNPDYEVAELACFCDGSDSRIKGLPWRYFPATPRVRTPEFNNDPTAKWGRWVFDDVCLEFKPNFVCDVRDWWNFEWQSRSPARKYFDWGVLAPVDSIPQKEEWLSTFSSADAVFTYTDWGTKVLQDSLGDSLKSYGAAPHCISKSFYPRDKAKLREAWGIPNNVFIVGTVMRNMVRKLYPDLIEAFADFLSTAPKEIASKTYLYIHSCYPDVGWKLPKLIKQYGVASRTYFTYKCTSCKRAYSSFYHGSKINCKFCNAHSAILPGWNDGVEEEQLGEVFNLFDCYVQYSVCEGFGIPMLEAAASGIPVFAVDYSAMSEVVRNVGGYPIAVQRMSFDAGTESRRALPDNKDFITKITSFLSKSSTIKHNISYKTQELARKNYRWDNTIAAWTKFFESSRLDKWKNPGILHSVKVPDLSGLSEIEYVNWCAEYVANRPDLKNSYLCLKLADNLYDGRFIDGISEFGGDAVKYSNINREMVLNYFAMLCEQSNQFEKRRVNYGHYS